MIDPLFCLPCDRERTRDALALQVSFDYVIGSRTQIPRRHDTGWRTMPFHLCCMREPPCEGVAAHVECRNGESFETHAGDLIFIPAGQTHRIVDMDTPATAVSLWMHFRFRAMTVFDVLSQYELPRVISATENASLIRRMETLVALPRNLNFSESLEQQILGAGFCADLIRFGRRTASGDTFHYNTRRILPVMQFLSRAEKMSPLEELADSVHLSASRFLAVFRAATGMSPGRYFENERYRRACLMLLRDEYTIGEIAERLGYCSAFHFSSKFRKAAGMPPSEFRKQHLNRESEKDETSPSR
ncbi:MAG: AraC family transcriptional regulator [Victivallaceae bacterium]|nr:AraC family transcriptional regulator [Victivallaceae bacterium]